MERFGQETPTPVIMAPAPSPRVGPSPDSRVAWGMGPWLVIIPLAGFVVAAFIPILDNGFVLWDDDENFLENPYFRGLGAVHVSWAWSTFLVGVYQPLAWMLFEIQYVFCQLNPRGYHLTSLLLQVANTLVLYALTVALLVRCRSSCCRENPWACSLSAALATGLFAVHPLRVEAVAWVSCQPYLPCILFCMLAVLAYLRTFPMDSSPRWGWLAGSFLLFVVALLFKAVAVSLPVVLLILDAYPLRRIPDETGSWFTGKARRALLEKVPFVLVSLIFMGLAIVAKPQSRFPVEHYETFEGIGQACYAIWFYLRKTVMPVDLAALYPLPTTLNWSAFPYSLSILAALSVSTALFFLRRRWPGLLAGWLCYLLILSPNSGLVRISEQVAADRYSYMAMLGLVVVAAGGFRRLWRVSARWRPDARLGIIAIGLGVLMGLTAMTRNQCRTWLNSETLWTHALTHGARSSALAHNNLGLVLQGTARNEVAAAHYNEAIRLNPRYFRAHYNLGNLCHACGEYEAAEAHFADAVRLNPGFANAHYNLGIAFFERGSVEPAEAQFAETLRLEPGFGDAHFNLGIVLFTLGKYGAAKAHFADAVRLKPDDPDAYNASAMLMAACPEAKFRDGKEAIRLATRACELTEWKNPSCLNTLAAGQAEAGDFDAAVKSQNRAIELVTDARQKDDYRSRLVLYQAKKPYRQASPRREPAGASS